MRYILTITMILGLTTGLLHAIGERIIVRADTCNVANIAIFEYKTFQGQKGELVFRSDIYGKDEIRNQRLRFGETHVLFHEFLKERISELHYTYLGERQRGGVKGGYEKVRMRKVLPLKKGVGVVALDCSGGSVIIRKNTHKWRDKYNTLKNHPNTQKGLDKAKEFWDKTKSALPKGVIQTH